MTNGTSLLPIINFVTIQQKAINQSVTHQINESTNDQSINQSINHLITRSRNYETIKYWLLWL